MKDYDRFTFLDSIALIIITFISLGTRLWRISMPEVTTFDEIHFGNFSSWYIQKKFHFDIHPPLAKLIMAYIAKLTQYKGNIDYSNPRFLPTEHWYVSQRITPAIFSAFITPCLYGASRFLGLSILSSASIGLISSFDIAVIVEGSYILSDGVLHFFVTLNIFVLCMFLDKQTDFNAILLGLTLGAACACKYTALGLIALDGITQLIWILITMPNIIDIAKRGFYILGPAILVFYLSWTWHFIGHHIAGNDYTYFGPNYMDTVIKEDVLDISYMGRRVAKYSMLERIFVWNQKMNHINMRSKIPHPWESLPINWPLLLDKYVYFYGEKDSRIICMGNPAIHWSTTFSLVLCLFLHPNWKNALMIWGWFVSYIPFILVPRTMFHYHYIIPLLFAIMNMLIMIENGFSRGAMRLIIIALTVACFIGYVYYSPFAYYVDCPDCYEKRMFVKRWVKGPPHEVVFYGDKAFNTTKVYQEFPI